MTDDTNTTETTADSTDTTQEFADVATGGDTVTVDLQDCADEFRAEVERLSELKEQAEGCGADTDEDDADADDGDSDDIEWPPEEYGGLEFPIRAVKHRAQLVESDIDAMGGSQFVLKKARSGEAARATDLTLEGAQQTGTDPAAQATQQEHNIVQVCVERAPPGAPTTADGRLQTHALETPTFGWLRQRIENLNTYGTTDLSDF